MTDQKAARPQVRAGGAGVIGFTNAWVASVDEGRRRLPGWLAGVLAVIAVAVAMRGGAGLYALSPAPGVGLAGLVADRALQDACLLGPLVLFAAVMVFGVERRGRVQAVQPPARAAALGVGLGMGGYLLALALATAAGVVGRGGGVAAAAAPQLGVAAAAVLTLLQTGSEEAFFRGWLQPVLAARWGPWVGLAATSLLFAAAHGFVHALSPVAFLNDALASAAFGLLAYRTGGLYAPVAAHWGWNWIEQSVLGLSPNPGVDPLGALLDLDLRGPALLAGGADEMNGSLCATVALLVMAAGALAIGTRLRPATETA